MSATKLVQSDGGDWQVGDMVPCRVTLDGAPVALVGVTKETGADPSTFTEGTDDQTGTGNGWVDLGSNVYELRYTTTVSGRLDFEIRLTTASQKSVAHAYAVVEASTVAQPNTFVPVNGTVMLWEREKRTFRYTPDIDLTGKTIHWWAFPQGTGDVAGYDLGTMSGTKPGTTQAFTLDLSVLPTATVRQVYELYAYDSFDATNPVSLDINGKALPVRFEVQPLRDTV